MNVRQDEGESSHAPPVVPEFAKTSANFKSQVVHVAQSGTISDLNFKKKFSIPHTKNIDDKFGVSLCFQVYPIILLGLLQKDTRSDTLIVAKSNKTKSMNYR